MARLSVVLSVLTVLLSARATIQEPLHKHSSLVTDVIDFHKNLTQIESITGHEKAVGEWLSNSLEAQGYRVEKQTVMQDPLRFNILAWPGKQRDAKVLLSSHIDTVPPFYDYKHENHTISGRGSVDDKASLAAQVVAVNELLNSGSISADDIAVLFVVGEETDGAGMRKANELRLQPETTIFGEPTEGKLVSGHKGIMSVTIHAKGKSAHSGYPWLGRSANEVLLKVLTAVLKLEDRLPKSDKYGQTTFNIGRMEGGVAHNVVAESAEAEIAIRIASGTPSELKDAINATIESAVKDFLKDDLKAEDIVQLKYSLNSYPPVDIDHDVPGFEVMTVNYGTDIPNFDLTGKDQKRYLYGPGSIFVAHSDHEALLEEDLKNAVNSYKEIILHVLGKDALLAGMKADL